MTSNLVKCFFGKHGWVVAESHNPHRSYKPASDVHGYFKVECLKCHETFYIGFLSTAVAEVSKDMQEKTYTTFPRNMTVEGFIIKGYEKELWFRTGVGYEHPTENKESM